MRTVQSALIFTALTIGAASFSTGSVSALPLGSAAGGAELAARLDQASPIMQVRSRRGDGGVAAGIIGGMILGGIIASQRPYYYNYPPYGYYGYYRSYPYGDPAIAYCMRRFKSYDPYSMTYLGYDGFRHPCP